MVVFCVHVWQWCLYVRINCYQALEFQLPWIFLKSHLKTSFISSSFILNFTPIRDVCCTLEWAQIPGCIEILVLLLLQFCHLKRILKMARVRPGLWNKVNTFIKGPGWRPGKRRLGHRKEIPEVRVHSPSKELGDKKEKLEHLVASH